MNPPSRSFSRIAPVRSPRQTPYVTRILIALAAVLALMLLLVHLPVQRALPEVGWRVEAPDERIQLYDLAQETPPSRIVNPEAPPVIEPESTPPDSLTDAVAQSASQQEPDAPAQDTAVPEIYHLSALGPSADQPQIEGGPGSLFLRIEYPAEARRQGIEGRVILDFVVDTAGRTRDIMVHQSLHPLCDSSAVRALRDTRFVPGRRLGSPVNVRMRLPVRFQLLGQSDPTLASEAGPTGTP